MKYICLVVVLIVSFSSVWAQQVQINEAPAISEMMTNWVTLNRDQTRISGWRVQLMSVTDRKQVEEGKAKFRAQFPDIHADWAHEKPYYKLRVGVFRTKREAMSLIQTLKDFYPGAYPAQDNNIHPREFIE